MAAGVTIRSYEPLNAHQRVDEEHLLNRLVADTQDGDVVYDIGANVGTHSLVLASAVDVNVVGFEPNPRVYRWLTANVEANEFTGCVQTLPIGLSDTNKIATISLMHRRSALVPDNDDTDASTTLVPIYRADTIVKNKLTPPNKVKIDVEGHGPAVINGASETLRNHKPTVYVEPHSNVDKICSLLENIGYNIIQSEPYCIAES